MPAPAAPPAAPAKPAGVTIVESAPPKPPPAPTTSINVSQMPTQGDPTSTPPKRGSAMQRMTEALRAKATPKDSAAETASPAQKSPVTTPTKSQATPTTDEGAPAEIAPSSVSEAEAEPGEQTAPPQATDPNAKPIQGDKPKASPWKLVDQYKSQNAALQKEIADLRSQITPETDRKSLQERIEKAEKSYKELADEIRYVNYEKSPEFADQFHKPYEAAFRRALEDLSEVAVKDEATGVDRRLSGDDLAQIAFMSFAQAKEVTNRLFPDFANDIMSARKDIRQAWEKRQTALKEWREKGSEREQQAIEQYQRTRQEVEAQIRQTWEKANAEVAANEHHGIYFKPVEGDEEWNKRLAKGFELVDASYAENPANPQLTPEQRAQVVRRHAAVRARAAGWGALRYRNQKLNERIAELEKELSAFKSTTPATTGTESAPDEAPTSGRAMDRLAESLRKLAH